MTRGVESHLSIPADVPRSAPSTIHKAVAHAVLRLTLGFLFLLYGIAKLRMGSSVFADNLAQQFSKTFMPATLLHLFGSALPTIETVLGALLILGIFTAAALALTATLMLVLSSGLALLPDGGGIIPHNLIFAGLLFALLFTLEHSRFTLERVWKRA